MPQEETFSKYTAAQGKHYAAVRPDYHTSVYDFVLEHTRFGPSTLAVDLGCGPGNVARALAPHFARVVGVDPADGMLETATQISLDAKNVVYRKGTASDFDLLIAETDATDATASTGSPVFIDLIASGNAAHWFDMPSFWPLAARVVRPGGTVALWTTGGLSIHPATVAATQVQAIMDDYEDKLEPYMNDGNRVVRDGYQDLLKPWDAGVMAFPQEQYVRKEWTTDEQFLQVGTMQADMPTMEKIMSTSSPYTRWCETHPSLKGTEQDLLRLVRRKVEAVQQAAGVEPGKESVRGLSLGAVLIFKKALK
ncbi:methyltransferase domain-containing protein [Ophiostoma piceae UAMH 11346]|uniref:Methyltransferase domain-containing protein n=1 Tax=Ophiostoma piceae (strain UAMH 11346) TaxID=1262450 RepID=S3C3F8_OPHP1|nr:methyltransferase domain-containing protein [Ophiostoma piceae UAMH 11346]